jgi:hypothetical protein
MLLAMLAALGAAPDALAQGSDAAVVQELRRQLDEMRRRDEDMRRRVEQLEAIVARGGPRPPRAATAPVATPRAPSAVQADVQAAQAAAREARAAADEAQAVSRELARAPLPAAATPAGGPITEATVAGLAPAALVGNPFEDALRSDLPGIAFRVPGTDTQVRLYGFAKVSTWYDFNGRNQTDAPLAGAIPLTGSPAYRQGGEYGITARFSRFGIDSRTLTSLGTLETRIEGDFGGGTNNNALFRLRQAWAELGDERMRVLIGQSNSLWNEGLFETLIDATNLNQSFIRQAQIRLTGRLAQAGGGTLTGQISVEMPETQYTTANGVVTPDSRILGLASPAFNVMPDFHTRLTWRQDGLELVGRGMLRQLELRAPGTALEGVTSSRSATGFGVAGHVRFPMRWLSDDFGADELLGMAYYGQGIGRYFFSSTNGVDAVTNVDTLTNRTLNTAFNAVESWGVTAAYRRFWTPQLRSNFSYSYARQNFPSYVLDYQPGSVTALSLNSEVQQAFANLIWSPFGAVRNGVFGPGWLDVGVEYLFTRRDIVGASPSAGQGRPGHGIANRILFATVARF